MDSGKLSSVLWIELWNLFWKSCKFHYVGNKEERLSSFLVALKPALMIEWGHIYAYGIMGNLYIWEDIVNAEQCLQVLEQHMLPSRQNLFNKSLAYFRDTHYHSSESVWLPLFPNLSHLYLIVYLCVFKLSVLFLLGQITLSPQWTVEH